MYFQASWLLQDQKQTQLTPQFKLQDTVTVFACVCVLQQQCQQARHALRQDMTRFR